MSYTLKPEDIPDSMNSTVLLTKKFIAAVIGEAIDLGVVSPSVYEVVERKKGRHVRLCRSLDEANSKSLSSDEIRHWKGDE